MNEKANYNRKLEKLAGYYKVSKTIVQIALFQAYEHYLSMDELEQFIIPLKEKELNLKYQKKCKEVKK